MASRSRSDRAARDESVLGRFAAFLGTRAGRRMTRVLAAALVLLVTGIVVRHAKAQAYRLPGYRLDATRIRFVELPEGIDDRMRTALVDPRRFPLSVSLFDPDAERVVREAVGRHPMVREVRRVRIEYPSTVEVAVRVRMPIAWVRTSADQTFLLSDDRRLLGPRAYATALSKVRVPLPLVTGIRARAPSPGQAWEDREEQVAEAIEASRTAAAIYRDLRGRVIVKQVDLSRFPARPEDRADGEVRFVLADGRVVEWGRTERDLGDSGEDGYSRKVRRLEAWLDDPTLERKPTIDVRYRMRFETSVAER
jgi:cell division septal protein FtsQ